MTDYTHTIGFIYIGLSGGGIGVEADPLRLKFTFHPLGFGANHHKINHLGLKLTTHPIELKRNRAQGLAKFDMSVTTGAIVGRKNYLHKIESASLFLTPQGD